MKISKNQHRLSSDNVLTLKFYNRSIIHSSIKTNGRLVETSERQFAMSCVCKMETTKYVWVASCRDLNA